MSDGFSGRPEDLGGTVSPSPRVAQTKREQVERRKPGAGEASESRCARIGKISQAVMKSWDLQSRLTRVGWLFASQQELIKAD